MQFPSTIRSNASNRGVLAFSDTDSATDGRYSGYISYDHNDNAMKLHTNGGSERMRIDSSGNVGIGNTVASSMVGTASMTIGTGVSGEAAVHTVYSNSNTYGALYFADSTSGSARYQGGIEYQHPDDSLRFITSTNERMRITSGGSLLVGKQAEEGNDVGAELRSNGSVIATVDNSLPMFINRKSSGAELVRFAFDNSTIGNIGSKLANSQYRLYLGNSNTKILFDNGADRIYPVNNDGDARNGAIDLGLQGAAFKDLYLTGGVDFGGSVNSGGVTSSSNKLDDYEEGTWTPNFAGLTNSPGYYNLNGKYTKIGNIVHLQFFVQLSHNPAPTFTSQYDRIEVTGVPFPCDNGSGYQNSQGVVAAQSFLWNTYTYGSYPTTGQVGCSVDASSKMGFEVSGHGAIRSQVRNKSFIDSAAIVEASITYKTNS